MRWYTKHNCGIKGKRGGDGGNWTNRRREVDIKKVTSIEIT